MLHLRDFWPDGTDRAFRIEPPPAYLVLPADVVEGVVRTAPKRDANEREIIDHLESLGCLVWQLSQKGLPDLIVVMPDETTIRLLEVKNGEWRGKLTKAQQETLLRGLPFEVVQDKYEARHALGLSK